MPFGEMTITLDDVCTVLRIQVTCKPVSPESLLTERVESLVTIALGVTPNLAHQALLAMQGNSVGLQWLWELFGEVSDVDLGHKLGAQ